jgi:hypothetical protein
MRQYAYVDEKFITKKGWLNGLFPRSFEVTMPIIGGVSWHLEEKSSSIDTYTAKGFLIGQASIEKLKKYFDIADDYNNLSELLPLIEKFIKTEDKEKWLQESDNLDHDYYIYLLLSDNPPTLDPNKYLTLLIKKEISNGMPNIAFNELIENVIVKGTPYVDNSGNLAKTCKGSLTNLLRVQSVYRET